MLFHLKGKHYGSHCMCLVYSFWLFFLYGITIQLILLQVLDYCLIR